MLGFLVNISNQAATLVARLTSGRAANLDNLNATISSRAPSGTAVSNADYTAARATKLDNLDAAISAVSAVNSVQTGWFAVDFSGWVNGPGPGTQDGHAYHDVTITAVGAKAVVLWQSETTTGSSGGVTGTAARLTSATNLRVATQDNTAVGFGGRWTVIDFK